MSSRTPISAGNWKMHGDNAEADALCAGLQPLTEVRGVEIVLAPSFLQIARVAANFWGGPVGIAGQNMHHEPQGAYTGEVSPLQLREVATWVILGHSERRQFFGDDDSAVNRKLLAALEYGLRPIICVGEPLEDREAGRTEATLDRQVHGALSGADIPAGTVLAYEPVWAIGSGRAASGAQAQDAARFIRGVVAEVAGAAVAETVRILYGGSVKPGNIAEFAAQPDVDGALVGGAALNPAAFIAITRAIAQSSGAHSGGVAPAGG